MTWPYAYNPDIWPALITLVLVIYLGWYSWHRRNMPEAKPFAMACLMGAMWTIGVIFELSAVDIPTKVFWLKFQAVWLLPVASAMFCFVLQFSGHGRWLTPRSYALLFIVPLLSILGILTNNYHQFLWSGYHRGQNVFLYAGRFYWIMRSYVYLLGIANLLVLVRLALRSPRHRWPVAIILFGQVIGRVAYSVNTLNPELIRPGESILMILGTASVTYALAFLRFHAIDPVAAARSIILHQMEEGMIVIDLSGRILDVNPMAVAILGISDAELRQKSVGEVIPIDPDAISQPGRKKIGNPDIILGNGDSARQYNLNLTPLREKGGEWIGQLLLLRDVTEQKRAQSRILKQQSVVATLQERERLARELHDSIGQVLGFVSIQTQAALKWIENGGNLKAQSILRRVAEVAKEAHADIRQSILNLRTGSKEEWAFIPSLKEYLNKFSVNYDVRTDLSLPEGIEDFTFDPAVGVQLLRVIQEAVTNSYKHSGAHTLRVHVTANESKAQIVISDDGHGFDASRLEDGDGSHFGLIFMRERMEQVGGSLEISSIQGSGTVLKLDAPVRKQSEEQSESAAC